MTASRKNQGARPTRSGEWGGREEGEREVADGAQAGGGGEDCGDGVNGYGGGSDVAVRATGDREREVRFASEFD
jgi:hypothetical protein